MAIQHYKGPLGKFSYDDTEFYINRSPDGDARILKYIGDETDGSKINIPEGLIRCRSMFHMCRQLETPPIIPDGVTNCHAMFEKCSNLKIAPLIPDSVIDCGSMFKYCTSLDVTSKIPEKVESCYSMFYGCSRLKIPPAVPTGAKDCRYMFHSCTSLETAPVIPFGVRTCNQMFSYCSNLRSLPIVPATVTDSTLMFFRCDETVFQEGEFNLRHRGVSYNDFVDRLDKYHCRDALSNCLEDDDYCASVIKVFDKCDLTDDKFYRSIIDGIGSQIFVTSEDIENEIKIADKLVGPKLLSRRVNILQHENETQCEGQGDIERLFC